MFSDRVAQAMLKDFDEGGIEAFTSFCIALMVAIAYANLIVKFFTFALGLL
jgi:hypothetical protein